MTTSHEEKTSEPKELVDHDESCVSDLHQSTQGSQVSKPHNNAWLHNKGLWGVVAAVLVLLILMMSGGSTKKPTPEPVQHNFMEDDHEALLETLDSNLAHIQQSEKHMANLVNPLTVEGTANSQALLSRQNAPTNMFDGSPSNHAAQTKPGHGKAGSVFAGQGSYSKFGNQTTATTAIDATKIAHPRYTIASGEFIHAVLETALDSDLPGMLRAVTTEPVYAYVGEQALIPAGSRLIGQYSSSTAQGISRIFVVWNRIILPNGISVQLNSPGVDGLGQAGQAADSVNTHFLARFGEAALLSILSAGTSVSGVGSGDQYNSVSQYRMAIAQSFQQQASKSLQQTLPMKPTLKVFQGSALNVFVAHDMDFYNVLGQSEDDTESSGQVIDLGGHG